ncbi:MAG: DUF5309 family protein [Candidatus Hodarchaeota archaeon]
MALADTPFVNRIGWGPESGGTAIEWISEDLGSGKLKQVAANCSNCTSFVLNSVDGMDASDTAYQIEQGSILYVFDSTAACHTIAVVTSAPALGTGVSVTISILSGAFVSMAIDQPWYVVGRFANEGSIPGRPRPRQRVVTSNAFTILRQDVQITGTMKSTDMYAIGREDRHQVMLRLKELQRDREKAALYSMRVAKTSALAGLMDGVYGFLSGQSGTHINTATYTLTDSAVNTMVSFLWENGGRNLSFFGHIDQTAKFTRWDKNRIRTRVNEGKGGGHITSYLTESGIEIDLVPMPNVPTNLAFVLDTSKIKLRAKRGRKAIMEKLGKMGDFDDWQIISEFSMEMKGYNLKQHGMFTVLT